MVSITGTKEEIYNFIDETLCECPNNTTIYDCEDYKNCTECILKNETRFKFVIE